MRGGNKELVSEHPASNNNSRPLGKHEDHHIEDTNDSSNQIHGHTQTHSTNSSTNSSTHDNSHTAPDTMGDYTDSHPTTDNMIIGD